MERKSGAFTSQGHNLLGRIDGSVGFAFGVNGDLVGTTAAPINPLLGPLANNGGPTFTMALLPGSPAIDAGDDTLIDWHVLSNAALPQYQFTDPDAANCPQRFYRLSWP